MRSIPANERFRRSPNEKLKRSVQKEKCVLTIIISLIIGQLEGARCFLVHFHPEKVAPM